MLHYPLSTLQPQDRTAAGSRAAVTRGTFPILEGMSLYRLSIAEGCFREPHWHPNADELGYVTKGEALVTVFSSGNRHDVFRVREGDMYLAPSGSFHAIENVGRGNAEIVAVFSHESPEDFGLSGSVGCMSRDVMANTWGVPPSALGAITREAKDVLFGKTDGPAEIPAIADYANPLKYPLESMPPLIAAAGGTAKLARGDLWPALRTQSMFSLRMGRASMREPHWHPETAELGYVLAGRARMTVRLPGQGPKTVETYDLAPGDVYFIPKAYPHHIENLAATGGNAESELHFLIFFDKSVGNDIGYTGGISAFPRRIVAPTLGTTVSALPAYPDVAEDRMIVPDARGSAKP